MSESWSCDILNSIFKLSNAYIENKTLLIHYKCYRSDSVRELPWTVDYFECRERSKSQVHDPHIV